MVRCIRSEIYVNGPWTKSTSWRDEIDSVCAFIFSQIEKDWQNRRKDDVTVWISQEYVNTLEILTTISAGIIWKTLAPDII